MKFLLFFLFFLAKLAFAETNTFSLTSEAAKEGETFPLQYTCDGKDDQPNIAWKNAPKNTRSFALILADKDAPDGTFYHWVLYHIPAKLTSLPAAMTKLPAGIFVGNNSWNRATYNGPCPPKGKLHHYTFTLYALDTIPSLPNYAEASMVFAAMQNHILDEATLTLTYERLN